MIDMLKQISPLDSDIMVPCTRLQSLSLMTDD
jgi:hypothetical protein